MAVSAGITAYTILHAGATALATAAPYMAVAAVAGGTLYVVFQNQMRQLAMQSVRYGPSDVAMDQLREFCQLRPSDCRNPPIGRTITERVIGAVTHAVAPKPSPPIPQVYGPGPTFNTTNFPLEDAMQQPSTFTNDSLHGENFMPVDPCPPSGVCPPVDAGGPLVPFEGDGGVPPSPPTVTTITTEPELTLLASLIRSVWTATKVTVATPVVTVASERVASAVMGKMKGTWLHGKYRNLALTAPSGVICGLAVKIATPWLPHGGDLAILVGTQLATNRVCLEDSVMPDGDKGSGFFSDRVVIILKSTAATVATTVVISFWTNNPVAAAVGTVASTMFTSFFAKARWASTKF